MTGPDALERENAARRGPVADRASVSRETGGSAVTVLICAIGEALASDETAAIAGFGSFSARDRAARRGHDPRTGESIATGATGTPAFKAGKTSRHGRNRVTA